jgi:hypothetical protein
MNIMFLDEWLDNALYNLEQIRAEQLVSVDQIRLAAAIEQIKSSLEELRKD